MAATEPKAPFRIAIVGGGIGGLFCTLAVHHHCSAAGVPVQIDVYEQAAQYKEIGAGVGVGINAARLIHRLGIGDKLNSVAGHRTGIWITFRRFDNSEDIVTVPVNDNQTIRQAPCARSDLLDLLRGAVEERDAATLHTKKACKRVEVSQSRITGLFHADDAYRRTLATPSACNSATQRPQKPTSRLPAMAYTLLSVISSSWTSRSSQGRSHIVA